MTTLVRHFLEDSADRSPHKLALICGTHRLTYAAIENRANQLAHSLLGSGVRRGDRVAIDLPNTVEAVVAVFGVLKAGAVFVPLNPGTRRDRLRQVLHNCEAAGVIADPTSAVLEICRDTPPASLQTVLLTGEPPPIPTTRVTWQSWESTLAAHSTDRPPCQGIDLDLACLIYTSGSTGEPKGIMSDHQNVVFASGAIIEYLQNSESDVVINVLPLSFDYGLYQLLMTFRFGGTLVLERSFAYPAAFLQAIERERVTGLPGVPTLFAMILALDLTAWDLSSLRYLTNTAAALPARHLSEIRRRFPGARFYSMYGLTETKRSLYLPPEWLDRKPGSVGLPIPGTEAWLVDDQGHRLPNGSTGELVLRGRHVMRGYWRDPEATAARFRPGPLPGERLCYSGDQFRTDEDGFFYFLSRQDEVLKSRGEKVAPKEVEDVICGIEGVTQAAVIGVEDPVLGTALKAFVVAPGRELTAPEVLAHCRKHLEDFKMPRSVEFREALPLTSSGKIARKELR